MPNNSRTRLIAELGLSHGGSFKKALRYINQAAEAGADLVKFQCHRGQGGDRQDYWEQTDFTDAEWNDLKTCCVACGVEFLCSPFSLEAAQLMNPLVKRWKVASGQITNYELLAALIDTGKPIIASDGLANTNDIATFWGALRGGQKHTYMACISLYPTDPENIWVGHLRGFSESEGLSDHSGTIYPALIAAYNGARYVEVHVKDTDSVGNDLPSSIPYEDLKRLADGLTFISRLSREPIDYQSLPEIRDARRKYLFRPDTANHDV